MSYKKILSKGAKASFISIAEATPLCLTAKPVDGYQIA
jgi:hypothetical protein